MKKFRIPALPRKKTSLIRNKVFRAAAFLLILLPDWSVAFADSRTLDGPPGGIAGFFQTGSDGGANYSVPIAVPPGTGGFRPELSLDYSGRKGNGPLGLGWSLKGLGIIVRCSRPASETTKSDETVVQTKSDFCLDGRKLISLNGIRDDSEVEYGVEIDKGERIFSRGTCGGPCYFTIQDANGTIREFGRSENSRLKNPEGDEIRAWAINQITDRNGNFLRVIYGDNKDGSRPYPLEIRYTGNEAGDLLPQRSVLFSYEKRNDMESPGRIAPIKRRLSAIKTKADQKTIKEYRFAYEYSPVTLQSRLTHIRECDDIGDCLSPTVFEWEDGVLRFDEKESSAFDVPTHLPSRMIDMNGDARPDYVYRLADPGEYRVMLNEENNFDSSKTWILTRPFDVVKLITNGLGGRITVSYKSVGDSNLSRDANSSQAGSEFPIHVVSEYSISDGLGNDYIAELQYSGLKVDHTRDSISFAEIKTIHREENRETVNSYYRVFPLAGTVKRKTESATSDTPLEQSSFFHEAVKTERGVWRIDLTAEEELKNGRKRRLEYRYDNDRRLIMKSDYNKTTGDPVRNCYFYGDSSGDDWWKSRFVKSEKTSSDPESCLNSDTQAWESSSDIRLRRFVHDDAMNVIERLIWSDVKNKWIKTEFAYDAYGNVVRKTDTQGRRLIIAYDEKYHAFPVRKSIGRFAIAMEYEPGFGIKVRETDFNGGAVKWIPPVRIDGFGRVTEVLASRPEGDSPVVVRKTVISRGPNGKGLKTTVYARSAWDKENPEDWIWETRYQDALGRVYKVENKADDDRLIVRQREFDSRGRVVKASGPHYRPERRPLFNVPSLKPVAKGSTDALADWKSSEFPTAVGLDADFGISYPDELSKVDFANNSFLSLFEVGSVKEAERTKREYMDGFAGIPSFSDLLADENATSDLEFQRDSLGLIIFVFKDGSKIASLTYTDGGLPETASDAKGQTVVFVYDSWGRISEKRFFAAGGYPDTPLKTISYFYDQGLYAAGKLIAVSSPEATVTFSYDRIGHIKSRTMMVISDPDIAGWSFVAEYRRDPSGRLAEIVYPDNSKLAYLYAPGSAIREIRLKEADEKSFRPCLTYENRDASGNIGTVGYGDNLSAFHAYDSQGLPTRAGIFGTGGKLFDLEYSWSESGRLVSVIDVNQNAPCFLSRAFRHDSNGQPLLALGSYFSRFYEYDRRGNIVKTGEFSKASSFEVGSLKKGVAVKDDAAGIGYIMYSRKAVRGRFSSHPPHPRNADHFIAVFRRNGQWKYSDNGARLHPFLPSPGDMLVARFDFDSGKLTDLKGQNGFLDGIAYGYADGDTAFHCDRWNDEPNKGEFYITGSEMSPNVEFIDISADETPDMKRGFRPAAERVKIFEYDADKRRIREIRDNVGRRKIEYDANGNVAAKGDFRYSYDIEGRLVKVEKKIGEALKPVYEFAYGPLGGRLRKIEADGSKTFYISSLYEMAGSPKGYAHIKYIAGSMAVGRLANGETQVRYFHKFRDGSVIVFDGDGRFVDVLIYEPHGGIVRAVADEGGFISEFSLVRYDSKSGLHYLKDRHYDYEIGGFINFNFFSFGFPELYMKDFGYSTRGNK